ncbi:uncharacterized protein LOC121299354 isoform X2 [Polyodon spathula]|uniref:uncharacterized protein LOC121299354 isoform X2 n=1 Tax=Polyodon spathula TaxID=7913 RepID=UPI001B7E12BE|nr:uncharacterized protein LOC121299354 isoform X2 [Polyodon spathula]
MLYTIILLHVFQMLPVPISSGVWVRQWPTETRKVVGRSVEFHYRIESDQEQVQDCSPFWYIPDPATRRPVQNIKHEGLYEGRFTIGHPSDTSTALNITSLQMNDTNTYYCTMICKINGKVFRKSGNGSSLNVVEEDWEDDGLQVPISSGVWVRQWPTETRKVVGRSVEFHCRIESDQEQVQDCSPFWYIPDPATSRPVQNIKHEGLCEGRFTIGHPSDTSTVLNITSLQMNDTNTYYCTMICKINGKVFRKSGNGSSLNVVEEDWEDDGLQDSEDLTRLTRLLIAVNIFTLVVVTLVSCVYTLRKVLHKTALSKGIESKAAF